jgi:hypothetical protein
MVKLAVSECIDISLQFLAILSEPPYGYFIFWDLERFYILHPSELAVCSLSIFKFNTAANMLTFLSTLDRIIQRNPMHRNTFNRHSRAFKSQ